MAMVLGGALNRNDYRSPTTNYILVTAKTGALASSFSNMYMRHELYLGPLGEPKEGQTFYMGPRPPAPSL